MQYIKTYCTKIINYRQFWAGVKYLTTWQYLHWQTASRMINLLIPIGSKSWKQLNFSLKLLSSVVKQMHGLETGVSRKQSTTNFPKNSYVWVPAGKKCSFFGKFDVLCFLKTPVLRFALLRYYQRYILLS